MAISIDTVESVTLQGRSYVITSNEMVDTGQGVLQVPIMPLPPLLLGIFGTPAVFTINGGATYDPVSGQTTASTSTVNTNVYFEAATVSADQATGQEAVTGTIYADGKAFGFTTQALLILKVRVTGDRKLKVQT